MRTTNQISPNVYISLMERKALMSSKLSLSESTDPAGFIKRIEINYRGIFQKNLAKKIGGDIVYVANSAKNTAFSNGRYSDAPERNGVPCKYFAYVSNLSEQDLEAECGAKLDIDEADISVVLDDAMVKGVEPWGWHGIRPINEKVKPGGTLLVTSKKKAEDLVKFIGKKPFTYNIAILEGDNSFAGLWVYNDDLTDVRVLAAIAAIDPNVIDPEYLEEYVARKYGDRSVEAVKEAKKFLTIKEVTPEEGIEWPYKVPELPKWQDFEEGVAVPAIKRGFEIGPRGQSRSLNFRRGTTKSMRPVVRFDLCTKCTLCWAFCPDGCFDPTKDGLYDVHYEYCTGCGKCAEVCPPKECIVMVDELRFEDNPSPWESHKGDPQKYIKWVEEKKGPERVIHNRITGTGFNVKLVDNPIPPKVD